MNWDINPGGKPVNNLDKSVLLILLFFSTLTLVLDLSIRVILLIIAITYVIWKGIYIKNGKIIFTAVLAAILLGLVIYLNFCGYKIC